MWQPRYKQHTAETGIGANLIVKFGSTDDYMVQAAAAADSLMGVSGNVAASAGERVDVIREGIADVVFGGTVTRGAAVTAANVKPVTTAGTSYQHLIKSGGALPSFTVEKGFPDIAQYLLYTGCKVGKMSLNLTPEGVQKVSFDFTGKDEAVASSSADASGYLDLGKTSFSGAMIASITENSGGNVLSNKITKLDISLDNSLDTGVYCIGGGGKRGALSEGVTKVSGTAEILFEDVTLYNKAIAGTKTDLVITITNGTGAGTSGNEQLVLTLPELVFKQEAPTVSGDKGILISLPYEAFYENGANATQLMLTLKNAAMTI